MYSYLNGDQLAVRYTLQTDDLSKGGAKNFAKPYNDRKSYFEPCTGGLYDEETKTLLTTEFVSFEKRRGLKIVMQTARDDLSEFSLELPLNFMGKKTVVAGRISIFLTLRIPLRTTHTSTVI